MQSCGNGAFKRLFVSFDHLALPEARRIFAPTCEPLAASCGIQSLARGRPWPTAVDMWSLDTWPQGKPQCIGFLKNPPERPPDLGLRRRVKLLLKIRHRFRLNFRLSFNFKSPHLLTMVWKGRLFNKNTVSKAYQRGSLLIRIPSMPLSPTPIDNHCPDFSVYLDHASVCRMSNIIPHLDCFHWSLYSRNHSINVHRDQLQF